jgi:phosphopantetheinyl transferase
MAALSVETGVSVGVDLAPCEPLTDSFVGLWFSPAEQRWSRESNSAATARFIWAAKEAVYKAINQGEGFSPRDVEIHKNGSCLYRQAPLDDCRLEQHQIDQQIAVIATICRS